MCIGIKAKKSNGKMSEAYGGISFVLLLFLYFIKFAIERTNNSRFGIRIVRKTKQKKFQAVKENDFYDVTSSYAGEGDNYDGKKRRRKRSKETKSRQRGERRKRGVKQAERNRVRQTSTLPKKAVIPITLRL